MVNFYTIVAIASVLMSGSVLADHHKMVEKHIIISSDGEPGDIAEIMKQVESEISEDENVNVFVTVDDDGNVNITKSEAGMGQHHKIIKMKGEWGPPGMHTAGMMHGIHSPMNSDTANCVLKNISKAQSDSAARLIRQACETLNPGDE